ncbi:hypothetical protein ACN47E_007450 [Coniothyrium glycines]
MLMYHQKYDESTYSWECLQNESHWHFDTIMRAVDEAEMKLESIETPLFGNRASYCSILPDNWCWFPRTLKRIAITVTRSSPDILLHIHKLPHIEYLDITLCTLLQNHNEVTDFRWIWFAEWIISNNLHACYRQTAVKEFRLMANSQFGFCAHDLLRVLRLFPNLKRLGFAHVNLCCEHEDTWSDFLHGLACLKLDRLWLLNPQNLRRNGKEDYRMIKYQACAALPVAAQEVRYIERVLPWLKSGRPLFRRDVEYPGFTMFEVDEPGENKAHADQESREERHGCTIL